jgi:hypothetical protein
MQNEEKIKKIQELHPIDDVFFEALASDPHFDEELLRIILDDDKLVVESVIVQSDLKNLYGRSVRLDALCTLGNGVKCNIEVQRSDNDDHIRRVRYNASMITVKDSETGDHFSEIPEVYVVYISKFDVFDKGLTAYHIEKTIRETKDVIDDGLHEIFINTKVHDGSDLADLMECFNQTRVTNDKFPWFKEAIDYLKDTEGGRKSMCKIMDDYAKEYSKDESIDATIRTALMFNATTEQIIQALKQQYNLDRETALSRIENFKRIA